MTLGMSLPVFTALLTIFAVKKLPRLCGQGSLRNGR
jgi:hypothetical protein